MEVDRASGTARVAAMLRASHAMFDAKPSIFCDELAAPLAGLVDAPALQSAISMLRNEIARSASAGIADKFFNSSRLTTVVRARYAEDMLASAIERGVSQYVILGAGLDSYAYRKQKNERPLKIFEVDFPASQSEKRERLEALNIDIPSNVTFVPIDFETQTMLEVLSTAGLNFEEPTFFSWLGVTFFLTDEAIDSTFTQVSSLAKGSEIVFDYVLPFEMLDDDSRQVVNVIKAIGVSSGESPGHCFEPNALAKRLKALGFSEVWHLTPDDVEKQYFSDRSDGLEATRVFQYMKARV